MLSIIICSTSRKISNFLQENIEATCGVEYETIVIDNSESKYSIFAAYNLGVRRSKFPFLCFAHEDIAFRSSNWGIQLIEHMKLNHVGIIGVAGTHYLTRSIGQWGDSGINSVNYIQNTKQKNRPEALFNNYTNTNNPLAEVVCLDGFWFAMPKEIFSRISFDEMNFGGFHCYDMDICMQVRSIGYKAFICFDILIEHFSHGHFGPDWEFNANKWFLKWRSNLP